MTRFAAASILTALALAPGCAQVRKTGNADDAGSREERRARSTRTAPAPPRNEGQPAAPGRPPLPATPSGLVTDAATRQLKQELRKRGFLDNPSPGPELDAATSDALRQFQQREGLAATGFPDQETLRRLDIDASAAYRAAPQAR